MKALVVYDSEFGNTEKAAQAMGEALGSQEDVEVLRARDVQPEQLTGLQYLIVGSPTQAFQPTSATKEFLKDIPAQGLAGVKVAAFDTRISADDISPTILKFLLNILIKLFGYAVTPIANGLTKKGGELTVSPEGFYVEDTEGPLKEGELKRAADWVKQII